MIQVAMSLSVVIYAIACPFRLLLKRNFYCANYEVKP
jgi:hypothetical protein